MKWECELRDSLLAGAERTRGGILRHPVLKSKTCNVASSKATQTNTEFETTPMTGEPGKSFKEIN